MFTGIIQATVPIISINKKANFCTYTVKLPEHLLHGLALGGSVAHNGCCLTVTSITGNLVSFDLIKETLRLTNLGLLQVDDLINLERAYNLKAEIGGHLMSGHISCTAKISKIIVSENNRQIWFNVTDKTLQKYILHKGYIGVDGISLTVGEVINDRFCVHLIPETLTRTTICKKYLGDVVNIEIDPQTQAIIDTVERCMNVRFYQINLVFDKSKD